MESSSSCSLVEKIKVKIFSSNVDPYTYICPSAYDTAWLAMIPDSHNPSKPMFKNCLQWLINNQNEQGFWGDCDASAKPSLETLPATLASMVALKKWNTGTLLRQRGLSFIEANTEKLLKDIENRCPCWFIIVFPAMVRLSECAGIEIVFPDTVTETMSSIFLHQQKLLDKEELVGKHGFSPLLSYLEALPPWYKVSEEDICGNLSGDGSLFQSPSATAKAFMATGNIDSLSYLESLIQRCPNGVPQTYPMDEDLIKLCMINQLQRLGLAEHFDKEIEENLAKIYRISHFHNIDLLELAMQNYEFKQSIFIHELKELTRWVKDYGVTKMGFGREKTTYCYYSIAAATTHPNHSYVRTLVAKSAILITIADDFFDKEGSLRDLKHFTNAIIRWDSKGLNGHGKVIFNALDNLVSETATKYLEQGGIHDIKSGLQDLWCETFLSWLEEAKWNKKGQPPTIHDYLKNGMLSIAIHTMILPASCFLNPTFADQNLRPPQYQTITKLLMFICRMLNDMQSYKRETEEGKWNFLQLSLMMNPNLKMEDSIVEGREIIDEMTKEFLQRVLVDGESNLPKPCKLLHLTCLKVFHMFYNSSNAFDSDTQLLEDISNAFYLPLRRNTKPSNIDLSRRYSVPKMKGSTLQKLRFGGSFKLINACTSFGLHQAISLPALRNGYGIIALNPKPLIPCQFI
ncbi:(E,E)-geranyllinalool synthase [Vigna angularis]|uniref:(E,E)-geranyllinalool synthase n=1 Tax=Phaseolus angularis TaxID=3914 RepID=A0A8T0LDS4_PHAAN|nr:(E,E)-geranyllinalool synthase [Vigna angularis]